MTSPLPSLADVLYENLAIPLSEHRLDLRRLAFGRSMWAVAPQDQHSPPWMLAPYVKESGIREPFWEINPNQLRRVSDPRLGTGFAIILLHEAPDRGWLLFREDVERNEGTWPRSKRDTAFKIDENYVPGAPTFATFEALVDLLRPRLGL